MLSIRCIHIYLTISLSFVDRDLKKKAALYVVSVNKGNDSDDDDVDDDEFDE